MELLNFLVLLGETLMWAVRSLFSKYYPVEGSPMQKVAALFVILIGIFIITASKFNNSLRPGFVRIK